MLAEPQCSGSGIVGLALNGVPIFNSQTNDCCDAAIKNVHQMDTCNGFTSDAGIYRYLVFPVCLQQCISEKPSDIIGVALDGFPIYGPVDEDGHQLTSRDLDECHGKWHGSEYRYHVTADYPYFLRCFRGHVPAQNKLNPTSHRRGKRSYSWREAARLPSYGATLPSPLKMGDCKTCTDIRSCFDPYQRQRNKISNHWATRQSLTARLEPPKKAITRTLSQDPFYTHRNPYQPPSNPQNNYNHNNNHQNNNNFNGNHNNNHRNNHNSQSHSSSIPRISEMPVNFNSHFSTPTNPAYTQGNLRIQKNKKSLFSLWGHQDTTSVAPTQKISLPRTAFNSIRPQNPTSGKNTNSFQNRTPDPTFTTQPAKSLKGMFKNIIRLKNSNVASPQEAAQHNLIKSTSAKLSDSELMEVLESLRTRPGMMLKKKKSSGGPPVLTPGELRQMLEDTHVTKVPKRKQIDPLITLLEDDSGDTKLDLTKKSALSSEQQNLDPSKTRHKSDPISIQKVTQKMEHTLKSNKLKELWGGTVSSRPTSQPVTTRRPVWHRFTSTPSPWDQYVSQKAMSTQEVNDYHYINGQRIKIPDNVRWKYDLKRSHQIPSNMRQETQNRIKSIRHHNSLVKSAWGKRKRRSVYDSTSLIDVLSQIKPKHDFLHKKHQQVLLKCQPRNFKTPSPHNVNPENLNPQLLAAMLRERQQVKQSRFSRLFD